MKTLTNPETFAFTNHFNQSLLKNRITMMNKVASWQHSWRYVILGMILVLLAVSQKEIHSTTIKPTENETNNRYLVWKKGKLYGVVTPYATDKDLLMIKSALAECKVPFQLAGIRRNEKGHIVDISDVVLGEYGQEAMKVIKRRKGTPNIKFAFFDFCYDPSFGCYPNIHPHEFPNELAQTLLREGIISNGSLVKQHLLDASIGNKLNGIKITKTPMAKMENTWSGNGHNLLALSNANPKQMMLYVSKDNHLDLNDEFKKSVSIFLNGEEVPITKLHQVHIRQVGKVYLHKRRDFSASPQVASFFAKETKYVVWVELI